MEDMRRARAVSVPVGLLGGGQNIHAARNNNTRNAFACALVRSCVCVCVCVCVRACVRETRCVKCRQPCREEGEGAVHGRAIAIAIQVLCC